MAEVMEAATGAATEIEITIRAAVSEDAQEVVDGVEAVDEVVVAATEIEITIRAAVSEDAQEVV